MDTLPLEIIIEIATWDVQVYRGLVLSCARFARWTALVTIYEPMSWFGYDVRVVAVEKAIVWSWNGIKHRTDGPALVCANGSHRWYRHDKLHRDNGPAIVCANGAQYWYQHGKLHRDDGPAVVYAGGTQEWYQHGERHRADGPAVVCADVVQYWYQHDNLHRDGGPAIIRADGTQEWWLNGVRLGSRQFDELTGIKNGHTTDPTVR